MRDYSFNHGGNAMTTITERLARYRELNAKRTQGDFFVSDFNNHPGDILSKEKGEKHWIARCFADRKWDAPNKKFYNDSLQAAVCKDEASKEISANASFFVAAPAMYSDLEALHGVLERARTTLRGVSGRCTPEAQLTVETMLDAINAIMGKE